MVTAVVRINLIEVDKKINKSSDRKFAKLSLAKRLLVNLEILLLDVRTNG